MHPLGFIRFSSCLCFLSTLFISLPSEAVCSPGNPSYNQYIRRQRNRCEGIKPQVGVGSGVRLVSFSTYNVAQQGSELSLRIPRISTTMPVARIESLEPD